MDQLIALLGILYLGLILLIKAMIVGSIKEVGVQRRQFLAAMRGHLVWLELERYSPWNALLEFRMTFATTTTSLLL